MTDFPRCDSVLMIGTHPQTMGGIATVVRGYIENGLLARLPITYVATHCDGSALKKALMALRGLATAGARMLQSRPLVHVHLSSRASFWRKSLFCALARITGRPYVLHVHGSEFMKFFDEKCGAFGKAQVRACFARAALLIALSETWRNNLHRICPNAAIEVLPNAVALPDAAKRIPGEDPEVLFLGRLGDRKGTFDLVEAFALVAAEFPHAKLVCAGDGAVAEVRELATRLGIAERVSCPGWLSLEATAARLASATLFALPSYAEGLPMALLEAMAWGVPVITTPVGGIPEVVSDDINGMLVQAGDRRALARATAALLADEDLRHRLGASARGTISAKYSIHAAAERLEAIYARFGVRPRLPCSVSAKRATHVGPSSPA